MRPAELSARERDVHPPDGRTMDADPGVARPPNDGRGALRHTRRVIRSDTGGVRWRGVVAFVVLAFGLAWVPEGIVLASGMSLASPNAAGMALLVAVMFAPGVAALVVRRFVTREGFADAGLRLGPRRYYLAAWLGVPLLVSVVYGLTLLAGLGTLDPSLTQVTALIAGTGADVPPAPALAVGLVLQSLTVGVLLTTVATFGEEFGWTGYLLPRLLPLGRWRAALLYGLVWGLWHAPVIAAGYNYPGHPILGILAMCGFTMAVALIQTAAWLRAGSVLLTSFIHAGINAQGRGIWPVVVADVPPLLGGLTGVLGITLLALVGALLLARTSNADGANVAWRPPQPPARRSPTAAVFRVAAARRWCTRIPTVRCGGVVGRRMILVSRPGSSRRNPQQVRGVVTAGDGRHDAAG